MIGGTAAKLRFFEDGLGLPPCLPGGRGREFVSIVHLFRMSNIESGSLISKDGCIISLTPEDLENHCLADFSGHFR